MAQAARGNRRISRSALIRDFRRRHLVPQGIIVVDEARQQKLTCPLTLPLLEGLSDSAVVIGIAQMTAFTQIEKFHCRPRLHRLQASKE